MPPPLWEPQTRSTRGCKSTSASTCPHPRISKSAHPPSSCLRWGFRSKRLSRKELLGGKPIKKKMREAEQDQEKGEQRRDCSRVWGVSRTLELSHLKAWGPCFCTPYQSVPAYRLPRGESRSFQAHSGKAAPFQEQGGLAISSWGMKAPGKGV